MEPKVVQYEDPVRMHMQKFLVHETPKAFNIEVPGTPGSDGDENTPATAGTPAKNWSFPREVLARVFPHKRDDMPALFDFVQGAWTYAKHIGDAGKDALIKPDEETSKITAVCAKLGASLLATLDIDTYRQFTELALTVDSLTTAGSVRAEEKAAAKAIKDAEKKAISDKKKAEKKAEKDKAKQEAKEKKAAEKKAEKDAAAAEKQKQKDENKRPNKSQRQAALGKSQPPAEKPAKPLSKKAQAEMDRVHAEDAAKKAEKAKQVEHEGGDWNSIPEPIKEEAPKLSADDLLNDED